MGSRNRRAVRDQFLSDVLPVLEEDTEAERMG